MVHRTVALYIYIYLYRDEVLGGKNPCDPTTHATTVCLTQMMTRDLFVLAKLVVYPQLQ